MFHHVDRVQLLTDKPVFARHQSPEEVISKLVGRSQLPWEDDNVKDEGFRKLRMLKRSVLKCLSRDPQERPTASELLASWERLFDSFGADNTYTAPEPASSTLPVSSSGQA